MPRPGPERIPTLTREHPTRLKQIDARAEAEQISRAALLRRMHAYGLLNMPKGWKDPNPPSEQADE